MSDKFLEPAKDSPKPESPVYSSIGDWVGKNCVNPFVNTLLIDSHNAAANAVNLVSERTTGKQAMGKDKLLATGEAANMLSAEFVAQQVSSGLAMIAPYTIAGKFAGGTLRGVSTVSKLGRNASNLLKAERFTAGILNSEKTAQIVGGTIYDGFKDTHKGQSHLSNAAHSAILFTVLENANPLTHKLSWYKKYPSLIAIGAAGSAVAAATGAATYNIQKEQKLDGKHIAEEVSGQVLSGGVMNAFFPAAQQIAGKGLDRLNMTLGRGAPIVRFAQHRDLIGRDPAFDALLKNNSGARVQLTNHTEHQAIHKENKIILGKNWDIADAIHEGKHLEDGITNKSQLKPIGDLIADGQKDEAHKQFIAFRVEQENAARRLENEVRARGNKDASPKSELRANAPIKTLEEFIYLEQFNSEFQQFIKAPHKFSLETDSSTGVLPATDSLVTHLTNDRLKRDILDAALSTPGMAKQAASELGAMQNTPYIKALFHQALANPASRLEAVKHIDKLQAWDRLDAINAALFYPECQAIATQMIPSLPSLREQARARARALCDRSSTSAPENNKLPFKMSDRQQWLNSQIDQIVERYTSKPMSREEFEAIIKSFPKEDRKLVKEFINYSIGNCSDVGLLAQLKALNFDVLSESSPQGKKLLPVYTLSSTSCGNALAYLYRKVNNLDSSPTNLQHGMEIDLRNIDALTENGHHKNIIIFDDLSATPLSQTQKDLLKGVEKIKAIDIHSFEKGVNLFDFALGTKCVQEKLSALVAEAKAIKGNSSRLSTRNLVDAVLTEPVKKIVETLGNVEIIKSIGWRNHPLLPKTERTTPDSMESLYSWLVVPRISKEKVGTFLNKFSEEELPIATDMLINGQTYHSVENTLAKLTKVHGQIGKILEHHNVAQKNMRIVVDPKEESGGSGHLITYLYAKASHLPKENFISENQLNQIIKEDQGSGLWLTFMDDGLYSGTQMADLLRVKMERTKEDPHGGILQFDKILIASLGAAHSFKPNPKDHHELGDLRPTSNISALQNIWAYVGLSRWNTEGTSAAAPSNWRELCRQTSDTKKLVMTIAQPYTPYFSPQNLYMSSYFNQGPQIATRAINVATLAKSHTSPDSYCGIDTAVTAFWGYTDTNVPLLQAFAKDTLGI